MQGRWRQFASGSSSGSFAPMPTAGAPRVFAIGRLKEAAAEIRSVAKSDPVAAGDGVVSLMAFAP